MATTTVTVGLPSIAAEIRQAYDDRLLLAAQPKLVYAQLAEKRPIPKGMGNTINLRRFELLAPATTPLTEGVTPNGSTITVTNVPISVQQYGDFVQLSDVVEWTSIDPMVANIVRIQGQQAGNTIDQVARAAWGAGTTVRYAAGRVSRVTVQAGDIMNGTEIRKGVRTLENNNADRFDEYWVAVIHPNVGYDVEGASEWINTREYSDPADLYNGEIGQLYGVRFLKTTNALVYPGAGAAGIDVYGSIFFGSMAVGSSEIEGEAMQTIMKPLGSAGAADPLDQRQTTGWKATYGGGIQNQLFMVRVETAVSA